MKLSPEMTGDDDTNCNAFACAFVTPAHDHVHTKCLAISAVVNQERLALWIEAFTKSWKMYQFIFKVI